MAPPVWSVGQVLSAADVNTWFVPLEAEKAAGQTVTSSTTLVNDTALFLSVAANAVYVCDLFLWYDGAALGTGDLKFSFTTPASTVWNFQHLGYNAAGNDLERLSWQNGSTPWIFGTEGAGNPRGVTIKGRIATAGTSGTIQWQFAQQTSSATATTVHAQSYFTLQRVG
jgi:hypothetical protein